MQLQKQKGASLHCKLDIIDNASTIINDQQNIYSRHELNMQRKKYTSLRTFICLAISGKPEEASNRFAHFPDDRGKNRHYAIATCR